MKKVVSMQKESFVLKGNICYSQDKDHFRTVADGYLVCVDGISEGVYEELPEQYRNLPLIDCEDQLILPGLTDLHVHAPQYAFRGLGMDLELLDWLNTHTFPEESKYADLEYAKTAYQIFVEDMKNGPNTRACIFATLHVPATELLMDLLEETGMKTMVGKVNMDRNSPDILCEAGAEQSAADTAAWIEDVVGKYRNVQPILTPRFIPTCSDELMRLLKEIQKKYQLPVQSHLSENQGEIAWVKELCPSSAFYGDAYDQFGLFGGDCKTIMAHCVSSSDDEIRRMKERGVYIAHCPQSNTNLSSGIAPVRKFLDEGLRVGLGSDVAGGTVGSVFRAMADAIQVSKLRWRLTDDTMKPLTVQEAFYLGTVGGGSFFGKAGSFDAGYELDALVIDDSNLATPLKLSIPERVERVIYLSDDKNITKKFVGGHQIW
ncbi:amidohydrolase family protein [Diplocloster agilis]|uniref:amidohydrolase family protein n=1 Tax=Diplocloster agilis TaxID=2850323 RepID=UPI001EE7CCD9|nr:amidohydrolase family protein [Diplocloster agilis]